MLRSPLDGKRLLRDSSGSEAVEFLGTFLLLLVTVVSLLGILAYVYRAGELNAAARRAVRSVEVSGCYTEAETEALLRALLPNRETPEITLLDADGNPLPDGSRIQLRSTFTLVLRTSYTLEFFSALERGTLRVPLTAAARGMSEVYWKTDNSA